MTVSHYSPHTKLRQHTLRAAILLACLSPSSIAAQKPTLLTEAKVIELAKTTAPLASVAKAQHDVAQAKQNTSNRFANPQVSWMREAITRGPMGSQGNEDFYTVSLPINIARPLANRSLIASQSSWQKAQASLSTNQAITVTVLTYYDAVLAKKRVATHEQAVATLLEAARVLASRESAGVASGYESSRLAIATELARSHLAEANAILAATKAQLAGRLGIKANNLILSENLALISSVKREALVKRKWQSRSALRFAGESRGQAAKAVRRAKWAWLPTLTLSGGVKTSTTPGFDLGTGYVLGVAVNIPIFNRGQNVSAQARSQQALALARLEQVTAQIRADIAAASNAYELTRKALVRFDKSASDDVAVLMKSAQSGYREGKRTIVELLDAQRTQLDVAERRLRLLGATKSAEIHLRSAAGDL